jgi:cold shock CspA family protein
MPAVVPGSGPREGTVVEFDDAAGYGSIGDGDDSWWFHCTEVADGSRTIEPGVTVRFRLVPGRLGRYEAADVMPVRPTRRPG